MSDAECVWFMVLLIVAGCTGTTEVETSMSRHGDAAAGRSGDHGAARDAGARSLETPRLDAATATSGDAGEPDVQPAAESSTSDPSPSESDGQPTDEVDDPDDISEEAALLERSPVSRDELCEAWGRDGREEARVLAEQVGLSEAESVFEGTLGEVLGQAAREGSVWVEFEITRVAHGWYTLQGQHVALLVGEDTLAQFGGGAEVLVGVDTPRVRLDPELGWPALGTTTAIVEARHAADHREWLGYLPRLANHVAVVRVSEDEEGVRLLHVVERLRGEIPDVVALRYGDDELDVAPPLGDELYVLSSYRGPLTTFTDLRPADPGLDEITEKLAAQDRGELQPFQPWEIINQLRPWAKGYRVSYAYHAAPAAFVTEIAGQARGISSGTGADYLAERVLRTLRGEAIEMLTTGGHTYELDFEHCGSRMLGAYSRALEAADASAWNCTERSSRNSEPVSELEHGVTATAENVAAVEQWIASSSPLTRLVDGDASWPDWPEDIPPGYWSAPLSPMQALSAYQAWWRIEVIDSVRHDDGLEVHLTGTDEYGESIDGKLQLPCVDTPGFDSGSRYIVPVMSGRNRVFSGAQMLLPGVLFPDRTEIAIVLGRTGGVQSF